MDQARGREEVFETDDPVLPEYEDPAMAAQMQQHLMDDPENVVPTPLDADAAFEVFHGKRFETRGLPGAC